MAAPPRFRVGETCILQHIGRPGFNGRECVIAVEYGLHPTNGEGGKRVGYGVKLAGDDRMYNAMPAQLRRKLAPARRRDIDALVDWSECAWRPMHVRLALAIAQARQGGA